MKHGHIFKDLAEYLGPDVADAAKELAKKKDYSEFKLAEALGRDVNEARNLLYKMHNSSLASFIKKKDNKIGWYIYYWTFQKDQVTDFLLSEKKSRLETVKDKLGRENKSSYFLCQNRCVSVDFDRAFELSFHCQECGGLLGQENSVGKVGVWNDEVATLEKEISELKSLKEKAMSKKMEETEKGSAPSPS